MRFPSIIPTLPLSIRWLFGLLQEQELGRTVTLHGRWSRRFRRRVLRSWHVPLVEVGDSVFLVAVCIK
jgi:hypothetical protein